MPTNIETTVTTKFKVEVELTEAEFAMLYTLLNTSVKSKETLFGFGIVKGVDLALYNKFVDGLAVDPEKLKDLIRC